MLGSHASNIFRGHSEALEKNFPLPNKNSPPALPPLLYFFCEDPSSCSSWVRLPPPSSCQRLSRESLSAPTKTRESLPVCLGGRETCASCNDDEGSDSVFARVRWGGKGRSGGTLNDKKILKFVKWGEGRGEAVPRTKVPNLIAVFFSPALLCREREREEQGTTVGRLLCHLKDVTGTLQRGREGGRA